MQQENTDPEQKDHASKTSRLLSLDALRGFDMFWIIGGDQLLKALAKGSESDTLKLLGQQMSHASWHGFKAYDLIFPLFMFLAGCSIPYAFLSKLKRGVPRSQLLFRILRRVALLIFLGIVYNGALRNFDEPRLASVLGLIAIGYGIASITFLYLQKPKHLVIATLSILALVSISQLSFPVEAGQKPLTAHTSINAYLDQNFLPGKIHGGRPSDPEGLFNLFSGSAIVLIGILTGLLLRKETIQGGRKTLFMIGAGLLLLLAAHLLNDWYPINKRIWTATFTLHTAGYSLILMALFYYLIDVRGWSKWSFLFRVIGMNAITIYLATKLFDFSRPSRYLFEGLANQFESHKGVILILGALAIKFALLLFLYRRKIFIRV